MALLCWGLGRRPPRAPPGQLCGPWRVARHHPGAGTRLSAREDASAGQGPGGVHAEQTSRPRHREKYVASEDAPAKGPREENAQREAEFGFFTRPRAG